MKAIRILVLESNDKSISQIIEILKNNNFLVDICSNNDEFLESIYYNLYDLYLLNINEEKAIPRFQLIKLLNECHDMTMKMVIASISSIIKPSFISGCDECVISNVDEDEIILRIKALIRRQLKIYNEIILGEKPLLILDYLFKFRDTFVPIEDLEKEIYPACSDSKNGVIRFHIHKIRQLLGNDIILSNRVSGYKINI